MFVRQGNFYAGGADVPAVLGLKLISNSMIRSKVEERGFDQVQVFDKDDWNPPFQVPSADYNVVVVGRRAGPDAELSLPSGVAWALDLGGPAQQASAPQGAPPPPSVPPVWRAPAPPPVAASATATPEPSRTVGFAIIAGLAFLGLSLFGGRRSA